MLQGKHLEETQKTITDEFFWKTTDGIELFAQKWDAGQSTRAAILVIHGFGEHSSRYSQWAFSLLEKGISVLSFDLRGFGKTSGKSGKYYDYNKYLEDIELLIEKGREHFKNLPLFLYGHSMGGNFVINYAASHNLDIAGVIVSSPWLELVVPIPRFLLLFVDIVGRFFPKIKIKVPVKPEDISREIREVHKYKTDQLIHNNLSFGLLSQVIQHGIVGKRSIHKINLPLLIMHGNADKITSFNASKEFVMNAGQKTTFIEWPEAFHELHHDLDRYKVFKCMLDWINKQIAK